MLPSLRVAVWNVEWAKLISAKTQALLGLLGSFDPDIVCLTESYSDLLAGGYQVEAEENWGHPIRKGRRKVLLWSRLPWHSVDRVGSASLPSGRDVSATADTALGPVDVTGVCIPWSHAHVKDGRRDRRPWEDHLQFVQGITPLLAPEPPRPRILLGDFNQRIPCGSQPVKAFEALKGALAP